MTAVVRTTAVGVFQDHDQAERAVEALRAAGFSAEQIGVAVRPGERSHDGPEAAHSLAPESGLAGAVAGGMVGGLVGAGAAAAGLVPGLGPVVGLGLLAAAAGGVATGAVAGGLLGALLGLSIPEEEAHYFQEEVEAGRTLVTVRAGDRYEDAIAILRAHGAYGKGAPLI
jgi:hypothetical protein